MKLGKFTRKIMLASFASMAMASGASATNVLLFDDFIYANDVWGTALAGLGVNVTSVTDDSAFNAAIGGGYDLVVVQLDSTGHSLDLSSYLSGGGKLIYGNWMSTDDATVGVTQGSVNQYGMQITSAALSAGLSSATQALTNPTYGIFSRELDGAVSLATLGSYSGILQTYNDQIIVNGFLGETMALTTDEVRLYQNEVTLLMAPVPEPSTYAMLGAGLVLLGVAARRKRSA
ncbi:PEP-CTERM sorting domain-containing protein [Duganella sp. BuS-21]|uniref:PEP-CTERM sorting domain-containing protein n=1 Tax=Duganella sp. BuS-21 TaxID=2943848 RepID=UPI0035A6670D